MIPFGVNPAAACCVAGAWDDGDGLAEAAALLCALLSFFTPTVDVGLGDAVVVVVVLLAPDVVDETIELDRDGFDPLARQVAIEEPSRRAIGDWRMLALCRRASLASTVLMILLSRACRRW